MEVPSVERIFISYRHEDAADAAGRLFDHLAPAFPPGNVFMDVEGILVGLDFAAEIEKHVRSCDALLAVIGPGWLDARDEHGALRLDDPDDWVRLEIQTALEAADVRVVPVLVGGATLPSKEQLPAPLETLTRRQAVRLTREHFVVEVQDLLRRLGRQSGGAPPGGSTGSTPGPGPGPTPSPSGDVQVRVVKATKLTMTLAIQMQSEHLLEVGTSVKLDGRKLKPDKWIGIHIAWNAEVEQRAVVLRSHSKGISSVYELEVDGTVIWSGTWGRIDADPAPS